MKYFAICAALCGLLLFAASPALSKLVGSSAPQSSGAIQNEPVVVYSLTGGTLIGTLHRQLIVYNSGFVTIAKLDQPVFPVPGVDMDVETASIGSDGAYKLLLELVQAGAAQVSDQTIPFSDTPLKTLTVLEGRTLALSRTFSWYGGAEWAAVDQTIDTFIASTFPGF